MNRRRLLAGIAAAASGGVAGCTGGGSDGEGGDDGGTPPSTPTGGGGGTPRLTDRAFERTGDCASSDAGVAGVTYGASLVRCEGCIGGSDGCAEAVLGSAEYDAGVDRLSVVVTAGSREGAGTACTQQLVYRSYEARLPFADGLPGETVVYHDPRGERSEVERASP